MNYKDLYLYENMKDLHTSWDVWVCVRSIIRNVGTLLAMAVKSTSTREKMLMKNMTRS